MLFTAFEPSGDLHASAVIAELRRRHPDLEINAWGGPRMRDAGATIIESTGDDALIGLPGLKKIREHKKMNKRIEAWALEHRPAIHVPVDSPAANFPICKALKAQGTTVVHLVAPQLWAWGSWRIRKLRRDTSLVLCLLPFEQAWFTKRDVPAKFIGHPLFDTHRDLDALGEVASHFPQGPTRVCLLPGSRPGELKHNTPLLIEAFERLKSKHEGLVAIMAAVDERAAEWLTDYASTGKGLPEGLTIVADKTDAAIHWSQVCLVASGTVTLQVARLQRPMVIFYRANPIMYSLLGRWLIEAEFLTLPNLIAGREIVPEFVPHFGDSTAIVDAAEAMLRDEALYAKQQRALAAVCEPFEGRSAGQSAADALEQVLGLVDSEPTVSE